MEGDYLLLDIDKPFALSMAFIALALIFDLFDGAVARALKVDSTLGIQLDSLADMVSFGAFPAILVATIGNHYSTLTLISAIVYLCAAALRLAKFNISGSEQTAYFSGLPSPAAAIGVLGIVVSYHDNKSSIIAISIWTLFMALLMVSTIPLFSLKSSKKPWYKNHLQLLLILASIVAIVFLKWQALPAIVLFYLILSMVKRKSFHY